MKEEKFLVGSNAFFKNIKDFKSKDKDYLILTDTPIGFKFQKEICLRGVDYFYHKNDGPKNLIERTLQTNDPILAGKFLIPEVAEAIGISIEDLKLLEDLIYRVDDKHKYQIIIYESIIQNNSFELTDEQIMKSYNCYLYYRKNWNKT